MGHFYGRVNSWDVVNEALNADASGTMQDNVFLRKLGPGYIDDCFRVAHQVNLDSVLFRFFSSSFLLLCFFDLVGE